MATAVETPNKVSDKVTVESLQGDIDAMNASVARDTMVHGVTVDVMAPVTVKTLRLPKIKGEHTAEKVNEIRAFCLKQIAGFARIADALTAKNDGKTLAYGLRLRGCQGTTTIDNLKALEIVADGKA